MPVSPHIEEMSAMLQQQLADITPKAAHRSELNGAQLRRIGDAVVKNSILSPYFSSMGIERGTADIGRAYVSRRSYFVGDVLILYYVYKERKELLDAYKDDTYHVRSLFRHTDYETRFVMLRHHYKTHVRAFLIRKYYNSSGEYPAWSRKEFPEIQDEADRYYAGRTKAWFDSKEHCYDGIELLSDFDPVTVSPAAVAVAAIRSGLERDVHVVEFLKKYYDEILNDFVGFHMLRDWLFSIQADRSRLGSGFRGYDTFGEFVESVIGVTAYALIGMATAVQDSIREKLDNMYNGNLI